MEDYKKLYKQTQRRMKEFIKRWDGIKLSSNDLFTEELKQIIEIQSEDEKIRKALISVLTSDFEKDNTIDGITVEEIVAWLEKQGEPINFKASRFYVGKEDIDNERVDGKIHNMTYNPTDKVEPKFKVGDWVVNKFGDVWHIDSYDKKNYQVSNEKGKYNYFPIEKQDEMHLWTIQDAKDGDILATEPIDSYPFPFVAIYENRGLDFFNSYCFIGFDGKFYENETGHSIESIHPATKEQRDTLIKAMTDAGYTFDFKKKELKKIVDEEQIKKNLQDNSFRRMFEQKPANKFESKFHVDDIIQYNGLGHNEYVIKEVHYPTHYINELGERMDMSYTDAHFTCIEHVDNSEDNRHEWSEEDEIGWTNTMIMIKEVASNHYTKGSIKLVIDWLKSIKQRIGG